MLHLSHDTSRCAVVGLPDQAIVLILEQSTAGLESDQTVFIMITDHLLLYPATRVISSWNLARAKKDINS